jgi:uncharacterized protein
MTAIKHLFWNQEQQRLRMVWRLMLHAVFIFVLTGVIIFVLLFLTVMVDSLFGGGLSNVLAGNDPMALLANPWLGSIVIPGSIFLGVFLGTLISGRWLDRRKFKDFGLSVSKTWLRDFAFGLFLGAFLMGLIFLFGWLTGNIQVVGHFRSYTESGKFLIPVLQSLISYIFVGFYEELISRGYHLINLSEGLKGKLFGKRWALILAFTLSSVVFGVLHLSNPNANWVSTLNLSLAGMFLGLGMVLTGSLAIPIGLHITWNFFQGNVFGFAVSGMMTSATLIVTDSVGPVWLTGGKFGPEAGVLGLVAMLIGSILIILWVKRQGHISLRDDLALYEPPEGHSQFADNLQYLSNE